MNEMNNSDVNNNISTDILAFAVGRRKRSVARVRMFKGSGRVILNGKSIDKLGFTKAQLIDFYKPLVISNLSSEYDFTIKVVGGGKTGQLEAARHGIARCIAKINDDVKKIMRKNRFLTRDPREKERKKIYHIGARKSPQFSKR